MATRADKAVIYMLQRIQDDPHLAYFMGHTHALELLLEARAEQLGVPYPELEKQFHATLRTADPREEAA